MNETLINPFSSISHPSSVQTSLFSLAVFVRFDPSGKYVAAGRHDGSLLIWDLETKATVRKLDGHIKSVTSADWSRNSRYILTTGRDWNVVIWDLSSEFDPPQRKRTIRLDSPVVSAQFHPRNSQIVLVVLDVGEVLVIDVRKNHSSRYELYETDIDESEEDQRSVMTCASFDPSGKLIYVGTLNGIILVFNARTKMLVARHKVSGAMKMIGFDFAKSARRMVANSSDRTLRQFILPHYPNNGEPAQVLESELDPTHRFSDPINRTMWYAMSYSPDGEWLAGGSADPSGHKIYIWDMSNDGRLSSALDGGPEPLTDLHWHPKKSYMASTTTQGTILLWHHPTPERWGAFAGGFEELDENDEYEEREDEFDIEDENDIFRRKMKEEEKEVDIESVPEPVQYKPVSLVGLQNNDEDFAWADDEPDDDTDEWNIHIVMLDEDVF